MPVAEVVGGIAALNNALGIAKALRDVEKAYDAATMKAKLAEIIEQMVDGKLALSDAKEQLADQKAEIERLRAAFEERSALVQADGGYKYRAGADGKPAGWPVCPACEQKDGRIVATVQNGSRTTGKCPVCASEFKPIVIYDPVGDQKLEQAAAQQSARIQDMSRRLNGSFP